MSMQQVDFTTMIAAVTELETEWLPARVEQAYQRDRYTISLALRTLKQRAWLTLSWHPQAARICEDAPPPRTPDTFTLSDQLRHQLGGLALVGMPIAAPWERVLDLQFAQRPGGEILFHLYLEIMGKYSNLILTNGDREIITCAHQVNEKQSSVRPILTGQPYTLPPKLLAQAPDPQESFSSWFDRVSLIPGTLQKQLLKPYRGLSPTLINSLITTAGLQPEQLNTSLAAEHWEKLFFYWQRWMEILETRSFQPGWTAQGYTVLGWGLTENSPNPGNSSPSENAPSENTSSENAPSEKVKKALTVQTLLQEYYGQYLNQQQFQQLHQQLSQKVSQALGKIKQKATTFENKLQESVGADRYRQQADILMAHLHEVRSGSKSITLTDFETNEPVTIPLNPEKNAVQNAQALYKQHQKLKRARLAVLPLLEELQPDIHYLEQVETILLQLKNYREAPDLDTLMEIRDELIQQSYLLPLPGKPDPRQPKSDSSQADFHRYNTPNGFEVLIGRNNRQNDILSFRVAGDYDLWFHSQEIPGSHVLLRLPAGGDVDRADLQFTADLAAYHSRAHQSEQVPIVYTAPKHVYKPKGAKPGMVIYKQEQVIWGHPQRIHPTI